MGALPKLSSTSTSLQKFQRAKVYRLNTNGEWVDQGTGYATIDYVEMSKDLHLVVIDEEDSDAILVHRISSKDIYRRQEGTIISWRDVELTTDLALSFQETAGCTHIWDKICEAQRTLQFNNLGGHDVARLSKGTNKAPETMQLKAVAKPFHAINDELRELPPVELSTLSLILKNVVECGDADQVRVADLIIQDQSFFSKLLGLFKTCEDLQAMEGLHLIFRLVRGIISLNNQQIFDKIFEEQYILDIIGSLEYDPDVPTKHQFRAFLKDHVVFKEAIPIKNPEVISKIHQTYKVGYIKDVILPKMVDDFTTMSSLNSIIHANNCAVIQLLKDDTAFIQELFARMRSSSITLGSKINLGSFLHEFCSLSKSLQPIQKTMLLRFLASEGIFDIITNMLQSEDKMLVYIGTEILILYLYQDPDQLRSYIVQQEQNLLFKLLVKGMLTDFGEDIYCQFFEVIHMLIDPTTISGPQGGKVIDIFYNHHLDQLIDMIASPCPPRNCLQSNKTTSGSSITNRSHLATRPDILLNICKLLCFCVLHHPNRINCNFLTNEVIEKVLFLTRRREKYLVLAAIGFMRALISRMDEHLIYYIMQNNLLNSIIEVFVENGDRYNMLHSVVLDLLEFIRKKGSTILISYIVDTFWDRLKNFEWLDSIRAFKLKYEQSLEICKTMKILDVAEMRTDPQSLVKDKEDHIKEDSPKSEGITKYDDDEACKSASRKTEETSNKHNNSSNKNKRRMPDSEPEEFESQTKKQKLEKQENDEAKAKPNESTSEDDSSKSHSNTAEA